MSFATYLGGQKLSKYAQHKYRKEDSGELAEGEEERQELKTLSPERAPGEFQVLILYKHTYNRESRGIGGENGRLYDEFSRVFLGGTATTT